MGCWGFSENRMVFRGLMWNTWTTRDADTRQVGGIIRRGIYVASNCKAVGTKYSRNNKENSRVSCNNKINGEWLYEWQVYVVTHRCSDDRELQKQRAPSLEGTSESNFEIFWCSRRSSRRKGLSGWMWSWDPNVRVSKNHFTRIEERSESQSIDEE